MRSTRAPWLVLGGLLLLARPSTSAPADDGAPSGMVAFFDAATGCPDGWMTATEASGRFLVATNDTNAVGQRIGTPLGDQEDRTHVHSFSAHATIDTRNLAAADGDNDQAAQAGDIGTDGMTAPATTGLPFTQLVVCKKP